jgi:uncharacterized protein (DUF885 family)
MRRRALGALALAALPLAARAKEAPGMDALAEEFLEQLWPLDTDAAIAVGRFDFAARLSLPSHEQRERRRKFYKAWLPRFEALAPARLTPTQRMDRDILLAQIRSDLWQLDELREWAWNPATHNPASALDKILHTDWAPMHERVHALQQRVRQLTAYYQAARQSLADVTREHTELALQQLPGVLSVLEEVESAAQQVGQGAITQPVWNAARAAVTGYEAQLKRLLPGARRSFRLGAALYEAKFQHDIQAGRSARQTYELALQRRDEVLASMAREADVLWPRLFAAEPPPADRLVRIGRVIDQLSSRHVARERFVEEIRAQIPQLEAWVREKDLITLDPDKPLVVRDTPEYARGVAGAGIEAPGPYRPQDATFYNVTPLDDALSAEQAESQLREYNHWILQILNIHEAVPGHYVQLLYANRAPSRVKALFGNGAMVEGWAVYAERLMIESGYGDSPEMRLMYGKWHLRSVTNTILDYSVHVLGMPEAAALDLLQRQAFQTAQEAREKWRRVQLTSVQLTSYFSGYSEIVALREKLQARPGFALKAFHEQFLSYGSAPVRLIAAEMLRP